MHACTLTCTSLCSYCKDIYWRVQGELKVYSTYHQLVWVSRLLFIERKLTDTFSATPLDNIFFWVSEEKKELSPSQVLYNKLKKYLSLSIYKYISLIHIKFRGFLSTEHNCSIIYEREQLRIHLVRPTTSKEQITQYDVNTFETILV